MMHIFINALAASAGGGLTYVRNVVPHLASRDDVRVTLLLTSALRQELGTWRNICFVEKNSTVSPARRFWHEQRELPKLIRSSGAEVLVSAGNFALWNSPVPQILLSRNSLYTSGDFRRDLRSRGDYTLWFDTQMKGALARRSVRRAHCTVAPSAAFAQELSQWTGVNVVPIHHGFDRESFFGDHTPLPGKIQRQLAEAECSLRLLFVSHYNYYRNFETLIRSLPELKKLMPRRKVKLILTCKFRSEENPGNYRADHAANLVKQLGLEDCVLELGAVPYGLLHHLYCACDLYVSPAYAESFAHPVIEAMASGLPVVASDIAVHREIAAEAAVYFPRFSPEQLAQKISDVAFSSHLASEMREKGLQRAQEFDWDKHVRQVLALAAELVNSPASNPSAFHADSSRFHR